jgi:hypothetical protein
VPMGEAVVASVISRGRLRATARVVIPLTERFASVTLDFKQTPP